MSYRRDIDDDRYLDQNEAERRREEHAELRELADKRTTAEAAIAQKQKASVQEWMMQVNREAIAAEYRHAGVEPPKNKDGTPNLVCGLSLLQHLGWTIQDTPEGRALVAPPPPPPWTGFKDADSLPTKEDAK